MERPFTFWRVLPLVGEPAHSYFSRLVLDECWHSPRQYAKDIGISADAFSPAELLDRILRLPIPSGDKARLQLWTPLDTGGGVVLAGQNLSDRHFRWSRRLHCPQCRNAVPYHRVWWHLECFRNCPIHRRPLVPVQQPYVSGRWWPKFEKTTRERAPEVCVGDGPDVIESFVIRCLLEHGTLPYARYLADFIDCSEFLGRLLNNPRQHSVPPFSAMDLQTGYAVLKDGCRSVAGHVSSWLDANPVFPMALTVRQLLGWAADYLVSDDEGLDPVLDDPSNLLLIAVSEMIRAECGRFLRR